MGWLDALPSDARSRLANCKSTKEDILLLAKAKWAQLKKREGGWAREDALVAVLELLDCNSQDFDLTREEYDGIIAQLL